MSDYLLGLDYGTGGSKACIIDTGGQVKAFAFEEYEIIHEFPGWSEHNANNYWDAACRLIRSCLQQASVAASDIKGLAVSSALPSMVMVDTEGHPIHRAYNLMDKRAVDQVEWLKKNIGEERIFALSGYRLEDHPLLVNVLWEKKHRPADFAHVRKVFTIDGYITAKLTGNASCHYSAAAFYGVAYNMRERHFDLSLLNELDIDPDLLPDLCECDDIVGRITAGAAAATGLSAGTPVAGGQVDCNASWLGAGAIAVGDFQSNLGTVGNFGIIHQNQDFNFSDIGRLMINFPYTVNSSQAFVTVPTTTTGGQCIRWIRDQLAQSEMEAEHAGGTSAYDALNV